MTTRTPPGLRFTCRGCADCCSSGFDLGPVERSVIEDLRDSDIESLWPEAVEGWYEHRPGPDGEPLAYLKQDRGRCVFLRDDNLCAVHALLGADRKPGFCREFPYHVVHEPRGAVIVTRPSCGGLHDSHLDGELLSPTDLSAILALPREQPRRRFEPASIEALPGVNVPLHTWLGWEDRLIEALEAQPTLEPAAALALVRTTLVATSGTQPLTPRPEQATAGASAILMALEQVMSMVLQQGENAPSDRIAFAKDAAERLPLAREQLTDLPPLDPDTAAYIHLLLRSQIQAKQWQAWGSVHAGLGYFYLGIWIARAGAADGSRQGFAEPYRQWLHFSANGMIQHILRRTSVALTDIFLHLP